MQDCKQKCTNSELILNLKTSRKPRFKAGSELQGKVNRVDVEILETSTEEMDSTELKLHFHMDACYSDREI